VSEDCAACLEVFADSDVPLPEPAAPVEEAEFLLIISIKPAREKQPVKNSPNAEAIKIARNFFLASIFMA
jgi:hypothetical protein